MAYKENIAEAVQELIKSAPDGYSEQQLPQFVQKDVADTVNYLESKFPNLIQTTFVNIKGVAIIPITK